MEHGDKGLVDSDQDEEEEEGLEFVDPRQEQLTLMQQRAAQKQEEKEDQPKTIMINGQMVPVASMNAQIT